MFDETGFRKKYRVHKSFFESEYYFSFLKDMQDRELMGHIRFCNDVLHYPPVAAYVLYRKDLYSRALERWEKLALGACFGYLFQFTEGYGYKKAASVWVGLSPTGIKNASYFIR